MEHLKKERRWCIWKLEIRNDTFTKVPYITPDTHGRSNAPDTWIDYETAERFFRERHEGDRIRGNGFFLSRRERNPEYCLCVIDVDAHHTEGRENANAAIMLAAFAGTYIERSPSGNGYHIICDVRADAIPLNCNNKPDFMMKNSAEELEIYIGGFTNRFMTYTGDQVSEGDRITDQTVNVLAFLRQYMAKPERVRTERIRRDELPVPPVPTEDVDILERLNLARRSKYGPSFVKLYDEGDYSDYDADRSKADFALVRKLCYWLGPDREKIDTAFRASGMMRGKWDETRGNTTYGGLTINKIIEQAETFYIPPQGHHERNTPSWQEELWSGQEPAHEIREIPDTTIHHTQITPEDVLRMINEIEDDVENNDRITVLPLMCGTGKSSALRLKMRQIIEANDGYGMIIVTDNIDRMRDYLLPYDDEMRLFFMDYSHLITVMTYETIAEDMANQSRCPILIMSTQRYINLSREQIAGFLQWDGGYRNLIVVDEQPYFKTQVDITYETAGKVYSAIQMGIPESPESLDDKRILLEDWGSVRRYMDAVIYRAMHAYDETGQYYRWQHINWNEQERFERIRKLLEKYRRPLNDYQMGDETEDIFTLVRAIHQILTKGALFQMRIFADGRRNAKLSVLLDNFSKYYNLDAKVIILDGTADVSTEYELYDGLLDIVNCDQYKRDLDLLHIRIIDKKTGKTMLRNNQELQQRVFQEVKDYLDENIPPEEQKAVFSYKYYNRNLIRQYGERNISWFGKIRGTNDFRNARFIAQIGMNRYSDASYFLFELEKDADLIRQLEAMDYAEQTAFIKQRISARDGFTRKAANNELLAELEQNIFRGTIRNSNTTEPYTFFLFTSLWHNDLIRRIHDRFDPLNAHITEERAPLMEQVMGFMTRSNPDGTRSHAQMIVDWHDREVGIGEIYSYQNVMDGTGLSLHQIRKARDQDRNKVLNELFASERQPGRSATFLKHENWFWPEEETTEEDDE